ncbi:hypothetical protein ACFQH8_15500 [Halomicroarcula sp. GCM10025710]
MTDALPVHVNRQALHDLEVPTAFEATGSFDVRLVNHGESLHVHLHIDDALSGVATLEASNHYVNAETERRVRIEVDDDADLPVRGSLKVVTGYGAQTRYIDVELQEPGPSEGPVLVDESLSKPRPKSDEGTGSLLPEDQSVPVLALGGWRWSSPSSPSPSSTTSASCSGRWPSSVPRCSRCTSAGPSRRHSSSLSVGTPLRLPSSSNRFARRNRAR